MENIILTNNKDLRLVSVKVGVLSTLRFELPLVSASATHVEVIVTSGTVHSAYTATFIPETKRWQCDIAASQFPEVGKQSYEVAYVLDGKQFWDGKGWIEIEDATTSGIEPQPRPEPYRYAVVSVNGYGADAQGAVRIPKTVIATDSPTTTEGYMEGDIYFNRETGAMWTLCNVQGTLTWVFNYQDYYTKAETDEAIDRIAAYYITADAAGNPFPTRADLLNAQTYYSGGVARVPTRNDYAVVLADETHDGAEYRYIYAVADGQTTGQWEAQYPIETNDYSGLQNKPQINSVTLSGNKSASDLGLASKSEVDPMLFAQYYPEGNVKSASEFTANIKYGSFDDVHRTVSVLPFCNTGTAANDNSGLVGRVVIPPFVDAEGNPYITDDGTRYKVVGVSGSGSADGNGNLTALVAPNTVTTIGDGALEFCSLLASISLPAATTIGINAFNGCFLLATVDFGDTSRSYVPSLGEYAFYGVPTTCKIIVPYTQYDAWIAADGWKDLPQEFVRHPEKADKPATFMTGNLAQFDSNGNLADSEKKPSDFQSSLSAQQLANIAAVPSKANDADVVHKTGAETIAGSKTFTSGIIVSRGGSRVMYDQGGIYVEGGATIGFPGNSGTMALTADLRYALVTKTIDNGAVTLDDRAINAVAVSSALASLTINFPTATNGKARDFYVRIIIQSSAAPTITFYDPATSATVTSADIPFGASSLADIAPGDNVVLFTEIEANKWLVSIKHEEAAS